MSGDSGTFTSVMAAGPAAAEQALGVEVEARERGAPASAPPGDGERAGQVVLLGHDVGGPVAQALGLDEHDQGVAAGAGR